MCLESEKNPNKLETSLIEAIKVGVRASSECDFNKKKKKSKCKKLFIRSDVKHCCWRSRGVRTFEKERRDFRHLPAT